MYELFYFFLKNRLERLWKDGGRYNSKVNSYKIGIVVLFMQKKVNGSKYLLESIMS